MSAGDLLAAGADANGDLAGLGALGDWDVAPHPWAPSNPGFDERHAPTVITDVRAPLEQQRPNGTAYEQMLERVRYEGAYPTREKAEEVVRLVLSGLGRQLTGDERVDLAACLTVEAARVLTAQIPDPQPLTGWAFVKDLAARSGASPATTRWNTGSVFAAVTAHAGPDLITRILSQFRPAGPCCSAAPNSPTPRNRLPGETKGRTPAGPVGRPAAGGYLARSTARHRKHRWPDQKDSPGLGRRGPGLSLPSSQAATPTTAPGSRP